MKRKPIGSLASDPNDDLNYDPFYSNLPTSLPGVGTTQGGINTAPTLGVRLPNGQTSGRQLPMSGMALPTTPAPTLNPAQPRLGRSIPSIPGQDEMIAPVEATQSASTNGTQKIRDLFSGGLKGLGDFLYNPEQGKQIGNLLAEMGYSMAYRSAGNKDDYYSSWNRGTNLNNANSDYSRNTRDLLAKIDPERTKAMAGYDKLSGEEAMGLYDTVLNKERYMDMANNQSMSKSNAVLEAARLKYGSKGRPGVPGGGLSNAEQTKLQAYSKAIAPDEKKLAAIDDFLTNGLDKDGNIKGVYGTPFGTFTNTWTEEGSKAKAKLEAVKSIFRLQDAGTAASAAEMAKLEAKFGAAAPGSKAQADVIREMRVLVQKNRDLQRAGFSDRVTGFHDKKVGQIFGSGDAQQTPSSTPASGSEEVTDYTQFRRKK